MHLTIAIQEGLTKINCEIHRDQTMSARSARHHLDASLPELMTERRLNLAIQKVFVRESWSVLGGHQVHYYHRIVASSRVKPEVMSPAGHWPQLHAAIEAGADSVYFGLKHFTARAKVGFTLEELPEALRTLHSRGVKGFITFNTLIFEHELEEAARAITSIAKAGADALIVQDLGAVRLAHQIAPELELHGSTQMSVTNAEGIELAQSLGVTRVTMARELSLADLRLIRTRTSCEMELFVHGALCVAYSGQCFSSEAWGGRSANRGQCAQACRLPYDLIVDGKLEPLGDARYLLSPGDLFALHQVPEIVDIGISALKIEGRYKDADYVALTTHAYRKAVDDAWMGLNSEVSELERLQLEQVYSRGLAPHFLTGTNHQTVVEGRAPRHRGVLMGRVKRVLPDAVVIEASDSHRIAPLKAGDGLVFDAADWRSPEEKEEGGRVYEAFADSASSLSLRFANGAINFARIRIGDLVWRSHDSEIDRVVRPLIEAATPVKKQRLRVRVTAVSGASMHTEWTVIDQPQHSVIVISRAPLGVAANRGLTLEYLRDQLARLGNTAYELAELELDATANPFAPASLLNQLRREAVKELTELQGRARPHRVYEPAIPAHTPPLASNIAAQLHLLIRTPEQLGAALLLSPPSITLDYLDLYGLKPSVDRVKASGCTVRVASPRVLKPGEERIAAFLLRLDCPILVRSAGLMQALRDEGHQELTGDFSLNAANSMTAQTLLDLGLARLTPTHDLNADQTAELARNVGPDLIEAVIYQHLPVFHTEHCVFCRFLSTGTSYKDCGRPCETHRVELRDLAGLSHPVMADIGCRNTVFGAAAQEASLHLDSWLRAGIHHFRLEFVHESPDQLTRVVTAFVDALAGKRTFTQLNQDLKRIAPQGVTEGSLFVPKGYQQLPVLQ